MMYASFPASGYGIWIFSFSLALLGLLGGLCGLLFPRASRLGKFGAAGRRVLLLLVAAIPLAGGSVAAGGLDGALPGFVGSLVLLVVGAGATHWLLSSSADKGTIRFSVGLALLSLATGGWLTHRFIENAELLSPPLSEYDPGSLVEVKGVHAYTDRGSPIQLFMRVDIEAPPGNPSSPVQAPLDRSVNGSRVIAVGPSDARTICHGWTFCGGRYLISGPTVERILQENGYQRVEKPQAGDLVIYREGQEGLIVHSGLVKAVGEDGYVLVESKWGTHGRYLHEPSWQPYSQTFSYYHSERKRHLLLGLQFQTPAHAEEMATADTIPSS